MGGAGTDSGTVSGAGVGGMLAGVRVASKPAFAVLVGAAAFLAQDVFQRVTHVPVTVDEGVGFVTLFSWFAYWLIPQQLQDAGAAVVVAPAAPTSAAA
jgi:hypothetical protein